MDDADRKSPKDLMDRAGELYSHIFSLPAPELSKALADLRRENQFMHSLVMHLHGQNRPPKV